MDLPWRLTEHSEKVCCSFCKREASPTVWRLQGTVHTGLLWTLHLFLEKSCCFRVLLWHQSSHFCHLHSGPWAPSPWLVLVRDGLFCLVLTCLFSSILNLVVYFIIFPKYSEWHFICKSCSVSTEKKPRFYVSFIVSKWRNALQIYSSCSNATFKSAVMKEWEDIAFEKTHELILFLH